MTDAFYILNEEGLISHELTRELIKMVGFRWIDSNGIWFRNFLLERGEADYSDYVIVDFKMLKTTIQNSV